MLETRSESFWNKSCEAAAELLQCRGIDMEAAVARAAALEIELPSWGMGRGGTRFGRYPDGSEANTVLEKIEDCALVHALTGATPSVATHFPWDGANLDEARQTLEAILSAGLRPGAVNSNTFSRRASGPLDHRMRFGSLTNPFEDVRRASVDHNLECLEIMRMFGSRYLSVWLPDGTNSPGQLSLFDQARWLDQTLAEIYSKLGPDETMLVEYKLFEPGFYATAIPDWGRAYGIAEKLGPRAAVLVDLGHHAHGTNIEQIVAHLIHLGKFGGFHFNDRKYADDDLATGSLDPAQLFRIFVVLLEAGRRGLKPFSEVSLVIDQSHNIKNPIEEMIESVEAIQRAHVQALCVDYERLGEARAVGDAAAADQLLKNAFHGPAADAILWKSRVSRGLPADPLAALREDGHIERRRTERGGAAAEVGKSAGVLGG
jgi:L-rhamnose isomerase/sugar isomerase